MRQWSLRHLHGEWERQWEGLVESEGELKAELLLLRLAHEQPHVVQQVWHVGPVGERSVGLWVHPGERWRRRLGLGVRPARPERHRELDALADGHAEAEVHAEAKLRLARVPLVALAAAQEAAVVEHALGVRVERPVVSFARAARLALYLHEAVVQRQVVPDRVGPRLPMQQRRVLR